MKNASNDNEPFTFQSLAAATAKLLNPNEKQNDERREDGAAQQRTERGPEQKGEYVEQRLRELASFERRARGHQKPR